ncbi:MAG: hypothetical protein AB7F99_18710 [Vicinamibacterales bacterium]
MTSRSRRTILQWGAVLVGLFAFRLAYGLTRELFFEDHTQIYLMGLRYYATGVWPYFGADVVWTQSEIPGALQALLVGLPLRLLPVPEAPYVALNLISMATLSVFAWYITKRLPVPKWLAWGWLMTVPWTLEFSTHIINPSYLLPSALVFFIGFFEALPVFRLGTLPRPVAFACMGAALAWTIQIHMSWPLLLPYAGLAWLSGWRSGARSMLGDTAGMLGGLLLTGSLLIPTFVTYGFGGGTGGTLRNILIRPVEPWVAFETLARLFSFASLEVWRFIAVDDGKRQMLLLRHLWLAPLALATWMAGIWQPIWMLREWFRSQSAVPGWTGMRWLLAGTVLVVYASYWFVLEPPQAHAFYVLAPIAFMYAAYCWTFIDSPRWRRVAAGLLVINVAFHVGQAWIQAPVRSLYQHREVVAAAIRLKEPEIFAHRRPFAIDPGPLVLADPSRPYNAVQDVRFADATLTLGPRRVALWQLTLHNTNPRVAYRDILYRTRYLDARGTVLLERSDYIKAVFQPSTVQPLEVNDQFVNVPYVGATIEMLGAEALLPVPR